MFKVTLPAVFFAVALAAIPARGQGPGPACLEYEPATVTVTGVIHRMLFPGPPEYSSVEEGDMPLWNWILFLEKPVCVNARPVDTLYEEEYGVMRMQLAPVYMDNMSERYKNVLGKRVAVKGELYHSHTGCHVTKVLIMPRSIMLAK
ncbi:DUF4431 domain-containing protein [Candidatus Saganbacteria bacterium]|uniref:DUF4431 domain-containing protein n=1 Tax=Candidatus Saganbacteria bacterium TaxID=2575572 RepID=A0A9D6UM08_UNCSA|nr:DUF4431 domain-containing protein [Candidatus Saganbacteria bacterium]